MKEKITSALMVVKAIAEAISEAKQIPSGHLYAMVMDKMSLNDYQTIISVLKNAGLITVESSHLIKWNGPQWEL